ncbi:MAG: hypothetical protein LBQ19_05630 [Synergistaceae bacterium]|jgi:hypothetical protein|nr:hypothetical protein [Synergistaceae bacterium]
MAERTEGAAAKKRVVRALCCLLVFAVLTASTPKNAGAGQVAGQLAAIAALEATITGEEYGLLGTALAEIALEIQIVTTEAKDYNLLMERNKRIDQDWENDHKPLASVVWSDITADIEGLYRDLASGDEALSFVEDLSTEKFDEQNPSFLDGPGDAAYVDFAALYEKRMNNWMQYAYGVLSANNGEARGVLNGQDKFGRLKDASLNAYYYRQLMQAGNQTRNAANQEISKLRTDAAREAEAAAKFNFDEIQERIDARAALKQSVGKWKSQSAGRGY